MPHHCPVDECGGHHDPNEVLIHVLAALVAGQLELLLELRLHRPGIPAHVQAGMNRLDAKILAATQVLIH